MTEYTGTQFDLHAVVDGVDTVATVTEVGGGIRRFVVGGDDATAPFAVDAERAFGSGVILVPWPNRVRDGRWTLDGVVQQLDISEPDRRNAIHGLLRFTSYRVVDRTPSSIVLAARVNPQPGYPFALSTSVAYTLGEVGSGVGLTIAHRIRNDSDRPAPVAVGAHPFPAIGGASPDDITVTVRAAIHIDVDERLLPVGTTPVGDTDLDLRDGRSLAVLEADDAFADPVWSDLEGIGRGSEHGLVAPDGRRTTVWGDENFPFWQVFTTEAYPGQRKAVAIEPMTAPADALNSGTGLRWLAPGEAWAPTWGIRAEGFPAAR